MKTYSVTYKNAYNNKVYIVAAENALQAVNCVQEVETCFDLRGNIYIPENWEFTAEAIEGITAKKSGIKSKINL